MKLVNMIVVVLEKEYPSRIATLPKSIIQSFHFLENFDYKKFPRSLVCIITNVNANYLNMGNRHM